MFWSWFLLINLWSIEIKKKNFHFDSFKQPKQWWIGNFFWLDTTRRTNFLGLHTKFRINPCSILFRIGVFTRISDVSWNRDTPKSSILDWDFPWNKPSSDKGVPPWLWKPPYDHWLILQHQDGLPLHVVGSYTSNTIQSSKISTRMPPAKLDWPNLELGSANVIIFHSFKS